MGKRRRLRLAEPPIGGGAQAPSNMPVPRPPARGAVRFETATFSGPLPPPEVLIRYNEAVPSAAERILAMAEQQSQHRRDLERRALDGKLANERVGQWMAFSLALPVTIGSLVLMGMGLWREGFGALLSVVVPLAGLFIYGRERRQKRDLEKKADAFGPRDTPAP